MRLLKRDRILLEDILERLKRAECFILSNNTAVMRVSSMTSTDVFTASYYPTERYSKITKEYGSELALLFTGIKNLENALDQTKGGHNDKSA